MSEVATKSLGLGTGIVLVEFFQNVKNGPQLIDIDLMMPYDFMTTKRWHQVLLGDDIGWWCEDVMFMYSGL